MDNIISPVDSDMNVKNIDENIENLNSEQTPPQFKINNDAPIVCARIARLEH